MNPIVVRRSHRLSLAEARRLAETMAKRLQGEFGGTYAWDGDTLRFRRTGASGHVAVTKGALEVHVELGLLLTPLRPLIEREISAFCDEQFRAPQRSRPASAVARRKGATGSSPARPK
jgi:putative polyhydroxyalkanoate system protein